MQKPYTEGRLRVLPEEPEKDYIRIRGTRLGSRYKVANVVIPTAGNSREFELEESMANAVRLVACWNACIGIPTEDLIKQAGDDAPVFALLMGYMKQRDELASVLQAAITCGMVPKSSAEDGGAALYSEMVRVADRIRAALKNVKDVTP